MARRKRSRAPESPRKRYARLLMDGQQGCPDGTWAILEPNRIAGCMRRRSDAHAVRQQLKKKHGTRVFILKTRGIRGIRL